MELFKIEHFNKEHGKTNFPEYHELSPEECCNVANAISLKYRIKAKSPLDFVQQLSSQQVYIDSKNAESEGFSLKSFVEQHKIVPLNKVFVNWYQFDKIDTMSFYDMSKYFDYIWYPSADDIDLFDLSFEWILSIDHDGTIKLLKNS